MKNILLALLLIFSISANAEISENTKQEITHLFTRLKSTGCEFNRNGTWYNAEKATEHLNQKYAYLLKKGLITTTEDFIVRAASESSMSHKAYLVKCNVKETKSSVWFREELAKFRTSKAQ